MLVKDIKEECKKRGLDFKGNSKKGELITMLTEYDQINNPDFVSKGVPSIENKNRNESITEVEKKVLGVNTSKFDIKEEQAIEKMSIQLIEVARKNGNVIDDITVDVNLITEFKQGYSKRLFARLEKLLNNRNVEINYTSSELEIEITAIQAIEEDLGEDEINYSIDSILKGIDTRQDSDEVKNFLSTINDYPLLSKEKELVLGKTIATSLAIIATGEELSFFEREDYENARELLSLSNKRLVVSVAKKYINRGMDLIDLVMEGMLGLEKAIIKYDYTTGFKFSTYATWWVRQGITRAIADKSKVIRVPVHMVETINKVTKVQRELTQTLGQEPTYEQIGEVLNMQLAEVENIFNIARDPIALEMPIGEDNSSLESFIEDDKHLTQSEESEKNELRRKLLEIIEEIPEREGEVLLYRYGLYDLDTAHLVLKLEEIKEIHDLLNFDFINSVEVEERLLVSTKLSDKIRTKYAKRVAQNNEKFSKRLSDLELIREKTDKKSIERVKKLEKSIDMIKETNVRYLEKIVEITEEQISILGKIDMLTGGVVKPLTLEEVGQLFDVTRERIRQIETKGKRKLKAFVDKEQMELFVHD